RNAHKFDDSFTDDYSATGNILLSQFSNGLTNNHYYDGTYKLGYNPNYQAVRDFLFTNLGQFTLDSREGHDPASYGLVEKVGAGYLMNATAFSSRVRVVAGVRFENTDLRTVSFDTQTNTLSKKANGSYLKVLPSVSLRYAFNSSTNLR